jgi:large conductance mechanosensitive channel
MFNEFRKFILRGNVVDLAVGVAVGAAFNSVVQSFVINIITPISSIFTGGGRFETKHITVHGANITYGAFINSLISFLIVAIVVFFLVVQPINKLTEITMHKKDTEDPETKKCLYCLSVIPSKATKCSFCTSDLKRAEEKA